MAGNTHWVQGKVRANKTDRTFSVQPQTAGPEKVKFDSNPPLLMYHEKKLKEVKVAYILNGQAKTVRKVQFLGVKVTPEPNGAGFKEQLISEERVHIPTEISFTLPTSGADNRCGILHFAALMKKQVTVDCTWTSNDTYEVNRVEVSGYPTITWECDKPKGYYDDSKIKETWDQLNDMGLLPDTSFGTAKLNYDGAKMAGERIDCRYSLKRIWEKYTEIWRHRPEVKWNETDEAVVFHN